MAGNKPSDGSPPAANGSENSTDATPRASTELPAEVRAKLRKLEKLEARYQGGFDLHGFSLPSLMRSCRTP